MQPGGLARTSRTMTANGTVKDTFLFTSESVNEGHPDKLCDQVCYPACCLLRSGAVAHQQRSPAVTLQVSDAVLDACLAQDPSAKVPTAF